jgi:catechol 2,3-dioxygenase-like lactoylglutathione lyase family enzyme
MIDHIRLYVSDLQKSKDFYLAALAPLGYEKVMEFPTSVGIGVQGKPDIWLTADEHGHIHGTHVALRADSRKIVDEFHKEAMAAGGTDNGAPGIRADYHPSYYAAFVHDPDGHNIEAVCHTPE